MSDYGRRRVIPKPRVFQAGSSAGTPFVASQSRPLETYQRRGSVLPVGSGATLTAAGPLTGFPSDSGAGIPLDQIPQWVRDLEGSTISGRPLQGGIGDLPMHGGLGNDGDYSSGIRDGYGNDRHAPLPPSLADWTQPTNIPEDILAQISASQGGVNPIDQSITGGVSIGGGVPFIPTGLDRQRVDSFVMASPLNMGSQSVSGQLEGIVNVQDIGTLGPQSGSGPLQGVVNAHNIDTFRSASLGLSASGNDLQQAGVGVPLSDSSAFMDSSLVAGQIGASMIPGVSGISGSGPLPAVGLDIYGRRQSGPLRPK